MALIPNLIAATVNPASLLNKKFNPNLVQQADGSWVDLSHPGGTINDVTPDTTNPYNAPSYWDRFANPALSGQVSDLSREWQLRQGLANQLNSVQGNVWANNAATTQHFAPTNLSNIPSQILGRLTGGNPDAQNLGQVGNTIASNALGVPQLNAQVSAADSGNKLFGATNITPLQNQIAYQQFNALNNREPQLERIADLDALNNQAAQNLRTTLIGNQAAVANANAGQRSLIADTTQRANMGDWFQSAYGASPNQYMTTPYTATVSPSGVSIPPSSAGPHAGFTPRLVTELAGIQNMLHGGNPGFAAGLVNNKTGQSFNDEPTIIAPNIGYSATEDGKLHRGGIPVEEATKPGESFLDANQAHKPLTTGQKLLNGIRFQAAGHSAPNSSRGAQMDARRAIANKQAQQDRINELTGILTSPPRNSRTGMSIYTHDQLQNMADELDKLVK